MPKLAGPSPNLGQKRRDVGTRALVACLCVCVALLVASVRGVGAVDAARGVFQTVTSPVASLGTLVSMPFRALGNVAHNLTTDQETLDELEAENDELRARNVELEEAEQTATRLRELLSLQDTYKLQSTGANIVSWSSDSWTRTVTIDKGSTAGVTPDMPVVDANGVLGQVIAVGPTTSTVRLLTDENSSIPVMVQSSRAQGMLTGSVSGQLYLTLVSVDLSVEVGDTVITSGLGGVYPKGLAVGVVTSVESDSGSMYYTIAVEPSANVSGVEEVLVITSLTEDQTADAADFEEADSQEMGTWADDEETDGTSDEADGGSAVTDSGSDSDETTSADDAEQTQ